MSARDRILVVRVGRTGDMVMITPALRMILDGFADAEVHLLGTPDGGRTLRGFDPRLTTFHLYDRRFPGSLVLPSRTRRRLALEGYARVFVLESNPHYHRLVARLAPRLHLLPAAGSRPAHFAARCMDAVEEGLRDAGLAVPSPRWVHLPLTTAGEEAARAHLARHGLAESDVLVGLHPTYHETAHAFWRDTQGRRHREWPQESWAALARRLVDAGRQRNLRLRPVVDLLPGEQSLLARFLAAAGDAVTVLTAPPDFQRYKATLSRFRLLVSPNTGPMHVAAAVGTPVLALFSHWSPADCGPYVPPERARVLRAEETAHPERGLAAIEPDAAAEAALGLLARPTSGSAPAGP